MIIHLHSARFIYEILEKEEYGYIFKNQVVMDVGANIGSFSLWVQPMASRIYAIDVSDDCLRVMGKSIRDNLLDNITTHHCAIAGESGTRLVNRSGDPHAGGWRIDIAGDYAVEAHTVNDFMVKHKIDHVDILKLDVEGAEAEILEAKDFPKHKINTVAGETHSTELHTRVNTALKAYGYTVYDVGESHFLARR
jgi:FkbM family methyltransferase